jgi:hypothetical protein
VKRSCFHVAVDIAYDAQRTAGQGAFTEHAPALP